MLIDVNVGGTDGVALNQVISFEFSEEVVGTTVLGLTPLCIGTTQIGGDGPPYFPMARAIVGGLLFSTFVSLLLLPTIYTWLDIIRHWPAAAGRSVLNGISRAGRFVLKPVAMRR